MQQFKQLKIAFKYGLTLCLSLGKRVTLVDLACLGANSQPAKEIIGFFMRPLTGLIMAATLTMLPSMALAKAKPQLPASATSVASDAQFAPSPQMISSLKGLYLGVGLGGVNTSYADTFAGLDEGSWHHANWQFAVNANAGYRFDKYVAAELAYDYFTPASAKLHGNEIHFRQMGFYGAAKLIVPVYTGFEGFAKIGLSYAHLSIKGSLPGQSSHPSHWGPLFGAGGQFFFTDNISILASYTRYPGMNNVGVNNSTMLPAANIVALGFAWRL